MLLFHLRGGIDYQKLSFRHKRMMTLLYRKTEGLPEAEKTAEIRTMIENFEPAVAQFKLCFPNHHTIITVPESPLFNVPEAESVTKPRLELLRQAGRQYAENEKIEPELLEQIGSPMIPEDVYAKIVNGEN